MFRRRHPLPFFRWLHGLLWPRTGWRRFGVYTVKRLIRLPGTPHSIAAGFACGAAVSFTPLVGFHILLGALLALVVRGNLLAVVVGTLVGNPWTFPFMWLASYEVGQFLLGGHSAAATTPTPWAFADLVRYATGAGQLLMTAGPIAAVKRLIADVSVLAWPTLVGAIPLGVVAGPAIYFPMVRVVAAYQDARRRRREGRRKAGKTRLGAARAPTDAGAT